MTSSLLFLALAIVLAASYRAHAGPWQKNPGTWYALYAVMILILAYAGLYDGPKGFTKIFPSVAIGLILVAVAMRKAQLQKTEVALRALLAISMARIPVELMLHQLGVEKLVPVAMTWDGFNFDILSGIAAALLWILYRAKVRVPRIWLALYNGVGLALLGIVVTTAVLSLPTPWQVISPEQPNVAILKFPFTALPAVIVPLVLYSHLRLLGSLRHKKQGVSA